ncbi:MAG TPA: tryptophan synthase subunit alpha [Actinophytocola sp.]|uniref:tryptophan synthase subunit alpha n=1 Tax=Actinophytocola sp. TaxID=1872138 RepID=UPI002F91EC90
MTEFFPRHGSGLALFLNAGDPPLPVLDDVVAMLDESGVDCLELAVPFPDSVTDGPVIRKSARRALDRGVELADVLAFVERVRPRLRHLRIALLADWSYSVRRTPLRSFVDDVAESGADGLLLHGLPPRLRAEYYAATGEAGLPIVTTCYHGVSSVDVVAEAAARASAYVYLVAHYGRSGTSAAPDHDALAATIAGLRARTAAPIAVGFGVRSGADVAALRSRGADAAIVGSAVVARVAEAQATGHDVTGALRDFVRSIRRPDTFNRARTGG